MVRMHGINFVTDEQVSQIEKGKKVAFFRMEDEWKDELLDEFRKGYEIHLLMGSMRIKGWIIVTYVDYFKWREIRNNTEIIKRAGYENKHELKNFLKILYGFELFGDHLDESEKPYIYYIEFEYKPFPELPS